MKDMAKYEGMEWITRLSVSFDKNHSGMVIQILVNDFDTTENKNGVRKIFSNETKRYCCGCEPKIR